MEDKGKIPRTVTLEEITISNMYEIEALIRVLEKKGLLIHISKYRYDIRTILKLIYYEKSNIHDYN